jgi:hypothetical protein
MRFCWGCIVQKVRKEKEGENFLTPGDAQE